MSLATTLPANDMGTPSSGVSKAYDATSPEHVVMMRTFYEKVFPYSLYYHWLNGGHSETTKQFQNREFSFTVGDDVYIRYQSFKDQAFMESEFLRLCPSKIDIGAIYTTRPRDKKSVLPSAFQPKEKELVFDIDMTDYDEIRTCCSGGDICHKCWKFMTIAMKVIHAALTEDFGFEHIMWVYSGRRGVHCWVSDERARNLSNEGRKAIVGYLEVIRGGSHQERKVNLSSQLHPHLQRSLEVLKAYFKDLILVEQDVLQRESGWMKMVKMVGDEEMRKELQNSWAKEPDSTSESKWDTLDIVVSKLGLQRKGWKLAALNTVKREIIFQYTYPRLDDKVTTGINHLLKSPFCVHPKTGRVCVPIHPDQFDTFDPLAVPTLDQIIEELRQVEETSGESSPNSGPRKSQLATQTSLRPYLKVFEEFVSGIRRQAQSELNGKFAC
ncbi:p48 polypeptide of DNA primase [Dispira parvispora]|uniref:DNA primase n=1 Tax=Dispira parvispora TaxID=1520584 RepID=A0A9W8ARP6_9FUNG|nr:p48 polypeptide of DNA primase [Dispira parvispora]